MAGKRKRNRPGRESLGGNKRQRVSGGNNLKEPVVKSAVLGRYYTQVFTLREYLLSKLPVTSKIRRRKILAVGRSRKSVGEDEDVLADHLDQVLVGVLNHGDISPEERLQQRTAFSQRVDTSDSNIGNTSILGGFSQVEVGLYLHILMHISPTSHLSISNSSSVY